MKKNMEELLSAILFVQQKKLKPIFDPDITIWMNTIESGRYEDTNKMFEEPTDVDYIELLR